MKQRIAAVLVATTAVFGVQSANAIGCLSGGAAGAVAGHVAGHHAVIGAIGGCVAGHYAAKKMKQKKAADAAAAQHQAAAPQHAATAPAAH